jgi:hypothetical protein
MRIHQLPIGTRFEYNGQEYVKTGPMIGTSDAGQRLIPKHAELRPLDNVEMAREEKPSETVPRTDVLKAFETFYRQCEALVPETRRAALETARDCFMKALGG